MVAATGVTMFTGVALSVGSSPAARWKLALIVIAGLNILVFHNGVYRTVNSWDWHASAPPAARLAAVVSLLCWTGVIIAGRFLAY